MNIKKLDGRSKLFHFGFNYKIENDIFDHNAKIPTSLRKLAGGEKEYIFVNSTDSLKFMKSCKFTCKRIYDCNVAHHYNARIKCNVFYIKHESTLALLKLSL